MPLLMKYKMKSLFEGPLLSWVICFESSRPEESGTWPFLKRRGWKTSGRGSSPGAEWLSCCGTRQRGAPRFTELRKQISHNKCSEWSVINGTRHKASCRRDCDLDLWKHGINVKTAYCFLFFRVYLAFCSWFVRKKGLRVRERERRVWENWE